MPMRSRGQVIEARRVGVAPARLIAGQLDAMGVGELNLLSASPSRLGLDRGPLQGRGRECVALDSLVASVRSGQSRVLLISGEAGIGKTALLEFLARRANGCRIVRTAGVAAERGFEFAGLQRLCIPLLDHLDDVPSPQRNALSTALGLRDGGSPDRFLVSLGIFGVLAKAAQDRPLICLVDDVQWLDHVSAHALAFVARRAAAIQSLGMVFATRHTNTDHELAGLPQLALSGIGDGESMALLQYLVPGPLDERVRDRMVAEAGGNPRALLGIPGLGLPEQLAGGFGRPDGPTSSDSAEETFRLILEKLPSATRQLLLIVAAEPVLDPVLVQRAAGRLGLEVDAATLEGAEALVELGRPLRFRHPLARAAVYRAATAAERRRAHGALSAATEPDADPDLRAWHRAQAASAPDEAVAGELVRASGRARERGGLPAAAAFYEQAAELTPDAERRAHRLLGAAQVKHQAGSLGSARRLLTKAIAGPLDELTRAQAERLGALLRVDSHPDDAAIARLISSARRLQALDPELARDTYGDVFYATLTSGGSATRRLTREVAAAVLANAEVRTPRQFLLPQDLLLEGLARFTTESPETGAPMLREALRAWADPAACAADGFRWLRLACIASHLLWDDDSWHNLTARLIESCRAAGALAVLPVGLDLGMTIRLLCGEADVARSMADEADRVARASANHVGWYRTTVLAAWGGRTAETGELVAVQAGPGERGPLESPNALHWAESVLANGLGRYEEALAAAEKGGEPADGVGFASWSRVELVEAAARSGHTERAAGAMEQISETARSSGTDWALGVAARSMALLGQGKSAESLYVEAIERLGRTRVRSDLARAHLVYGEWLRRQPRRVNAREHLRQAYEMLTDMTMDGFAERARRELLATGETARRRSPETIWELTAQEAEIARLAAEGHTNPEIGSCLFISMRTVEWHLRKVFRKLGISSRRELRAALTQPV